ncbi:uncharacterized protein LACBIDRAFT_317323 [Laccaria bicolor S238N-H82]|uniref:Predicted protein n=1 Tax=Laccaria bicolor (strain S238N-H82 / ATCC MYA-4686) TaxID=486041 RepID=B0D4X3_LACBS|nr:uncharacterized protein LACBIDRAFT_317323 [Laccaria bicolor S238N-H82]EDR10417.1 predicted protein [Laccaria bicolor S238N-H82]|eukprot:XP_001878867.1 predicted protein [Laccaria bicolor S238N-H82]
MERSNLQKAALIQTRKELADTEATFEDQLKGLEEKIKVSHKVLLQRVAKKEKRNL